MKIQHRALLAIVLTSLNLRTCIVALAPLVPRISHDLGIGSGVVGILGMIPTIAFALTAFILPQLTRRFTISQLLMWAMVFTALGQLWRVLGPSTFNLMAGTAIALLAIGITNAAMPIAVRQLFPNHVSSLSTTYLVTAQLGMRASPLLADPIAKAAASASLAGWQISLGSWAVLGVLGALAWLPLLGRGKREKTATVEEQKMPVWTTSLGVGLGVMFGFTSFVTYAGMAFIPQVFVEAGASAGFGGLMLGYWSMMGLIVNVVGPWTVARFSNPFPAVLIAAALFITGNVGMLTAPMSAPWLWVTLSSLGPLTFPMALTLINIRASTIEGATALSSFGQGLGYTLASFGPLLSGFVREATGGWTAVLAIWVASTVFMAIGGFFATRPVTIEQKLRLE